MAVTVVGSVAFDAVETPYGKRERILGGAATHFALADEWPQFQHPRRPEFLQTLPHVHDTAGFFVARMRVRGTGPT